MALKLTTSYLEDSLAVFRQYKKTAERAIEQVKDEELCAALDEENNSIAIIVKHMAGNMRSRFTDFLTTDGEKPDRNRDTEFVDPPSSREALMKMWEDGWKLCFRRARAAFGSGPFAHRDHPRRSALGDAGHQPADWSLCVSLRSNRFSCQAFSPRRMEAADYSARNVAAVPAAGVGWRSQPAVGATSRRWRYGRESPAGSRRGSGSRRRDAMASADAFAPLMVVMQGTR